MVSDGVVSLAPGADSSFMQFTWTDTITIGPGTLGIVKVLYDPSFAPGVITYTSISGFPSGWNMVTETIMSGQFWVGLYMPTRNTINPSIIFSVSCSG
jgi:hypothetical protein